MQSTCERIKGVQKTLPLFIIIISRVTNQAGPDESCANKSRSLLPKQPRAERRQITHPPLRSVSWQY